MTYRLLKRKIDSVSRKTSKMSIAHSRHSASRNSSSKNLKKNKFSNIKKYCVCLVIRLCVSEINV